jgi:hypothetical protein
MTDTQIFDMPVKQRLELVSPIRPDRMNTKRKFDDNIINKHNGIFLSMSLVYFHRPDSGRIVDSCILKTADFGAVGLLQPNELDIYLDVVSGD